MSLGRKSAAAPYGDVEAGFEPFGTGDIGLGEVRAVFSNRKFRFCSCPGTISLLGGRSLGLGVAGHTGWAYC